MDLRENEENFNIEEVGGQGMLRESVLRSMATQENLPKTIVVPSQSDLLYQDAIQRQ